MGEEIEITRKNYKTYIQLYERKDEIDKSAERLENILKIIEFLLLVVIIIKAGINSIIANIADSIFGISLFSVVIYTIVNPKIKSTYQTRKNKKLEEAFPNIDTKIDTEELIDNLIMKRIMSVRSVKSGRYIKKDEYRIMIQEEEFLKYQNSLEQVNEQKEKEEKRKRLLINKYNEIKKQMLEEYPSDYSKLDYNTSISVEELEKVKGKVKKLVKHDS